MPFASQGPLLVDTTLRDGVQAPGVVVGRADKVAIARELVAAGVPELEVGVPAMGADELADIRAVARAIGGERVITWCRGTAADLEAAQASGAATVHLSFPVSHLHQSVWKTSRQSMLRLMRGLVEEARRHFGRVFVGAQDASRADLEFVVEFAVAAQAAGAQRLRYADTVGRLAPTQTTAILGALKRAVPGLQLEFHPHDDLGLATANSLAAFDAGAEAVSVTVNGLGERAGNAALEEVAVAMRITHGIDLLTDFRRLSTLSQKVSAASGRPIPAEKPIIGAAAFLHESGIHCAGQLCDPRCYEAYSPELVGRERPEFALGSHTGGAAVRALLQARGVEIDAQQARELAAKVRQLARQRGGAIAGDELPALLLRRVA